MITIQDGKDILDTNLISDGYHTFGELYKHRIHLFVALCKSVINSKKYRKSIEEDYICDVDDYLEEQETRFGDIRDKLISISIIKSKIHFDGSKFDGWFIIQLETLVGQISYHLPNEYWDKCDFIETVEKANEWDGHTSDDVLERLLLI